VTSGYLRGDAYDTRFTELEAAGQDVHGEASFVQSLLAGGPGRGPVLDAGCGTGRVAIELHRRGIETVGVDLDPQMLAAARRKSPTIGWHQGDLATATVPGGAGGGPGPFAVVVMAGNVMIFVADGTEGAVVANMARHLAPAGLLVAGFQLRRGGLDVARYDQLAADAGLALASRFATWDRQPWTGAGDYAVSVHRRAAPS
jgi:SAM-dependent methyltransferase